MSNGQVASSGQSKRCFVVMGFGVKTDFATGRKLDLDKSYRLLIKPVVEEKGLVCVRADEIRHSGAIDVPMYQELLDSHVVIADLSTANPNALYELGVRHALRPRTTIVISENKLTYPFDLNHVAISSYTHLGEAIDFDEVMRFRQLLGETLEAVLKAEKTDSPIYTFLQQLVPPILQPHPLAGPPQPGCSSAAAAAPTAAAAAEPDKTLATIVAQGELAIQKGQFIQAKAFFALALQLHQCGPGGDNPARDPYLVQRLVLATYKSKQPDEISALNEALELLSGLGLDESNDPETVGLAGAIEKRLFDKGQGEDHLAKAIRYYGRGYYLRSDRYNGINLAYLLNVRTDTPLDESSNEKIADLVWANRLRREILLLCEKELADLRVREQRLATLSDKPTPADTLATEQLIGGREQTFWCLVTKAEAHFGLGEMKAYEDARAAANALGLADWMTQSMDEQIGKLKVLMEKHSSLLGGS